MAATSWNGEILPDSRSSLYTRRKLRQGLQNSIPDNVSARPLLTSITYQVMVIFIISTGLFGKATSFELHTERSVKAVRGRNVSLICSFTDPADAVYWYKHNSTGAPDDDAELVAREFLGKSDPVPGIERFRITEDYGLLISDVSIADETTYSCFVLLQTGITKRGYTDLKVIVLADSLGPKIGSCNTFVPGECTYNVPTDPPEEVVVVCELCGVRPSVNLEWVRSDDRVVEQALGPLIVEKDGLYDVVSILKVPKFGVDYQYLCQATGDAVNNASSTKVTFNEGTVPDGTVSRRGVVAALSILSVLSFIMIMICIVVLVRSMCKKDSSLSQARSKAAKQSRLTLSIVNTDPESSLLDKQDGEQDNLRRLQNHENEEVGSENEEETAKFEKEEKWSLLESRLKEYELNQTELERVISKQRSRIGEYEKNEITLNMLKRKVEELEQEREGDKAKFEVEQRLAESKLRRSVVIVEELTRENRILRKVMKEAGFQVQSSKRSRNSKKRPSVQSSILPIPWLFSEKKTESVSRLRTTRDHITLFKAWADKKYDDHDDNDKVRLDSQLEMYQGSLTDIHYSSVLLRNEDSIMRLQHMLMCPLFDIIQSSFLILSGSSFDRETKKGCRIKDE